MKIAFKNMKHIKSISKPFNYSFTLMFEEYPDEYIEVLKAPGKFIKKANTQVKLPKGKTGEMDAPYIADPDGKTLFERAIVILEHQRIAVNLAKNHMISNYIIQAVADEKLPYYVAIASHVDADKHQQEFERTDSFIVRLQFLDLGERDNWERLNNVRNKLRFDKNLSVKDALNLGIVILFAPEDCAKERTREALYYYLESEISSKRLEYVIYSVFCCMIDAYFEDEKEFKRMMRMLDGKTSLETKEKFASEIRRENRLKQLIAERDELNQEKDEAYALISLLLSKIIDRDDEDLKRQIAPFRNILKKCNV